MKIKQYIPMLLATALLAGCAFDDPQDNWSKPLFQADDSEEVPVTFNVSSQNNVDLTRAETSIVTFDEGEAVRVFVKQNKAGEATSYTGYDFTAAATGQSVDLDAPASPNPKPYFPAGVNSTVDAYAYYPATAGTTFSVADDQSSDAAYKASDLMWASNRTITKDVNDGKNNLKMNHQMAQLRVSANPAEGSSIEITKIQVVAKKSVTFTPEGSVASSTTSDPAGIITARLGKGEAYVLIPPQLISDVLIKVVTGGGTDSEIATYGFTAEGSFQAGCSYGVDITVAADQLGMTTAISNWNGMGSVVIAPSGNLVIDPIPAQRFISVGTAVEPDDYLVVKKNDVTLVRGLDYEVIYLNNKNAGTAYVVVTGMAGTNFEGCVGVAPFTITAAEASILYDGLAASTEVKTYGDEPFIKHLTNQGDGRVTYTSSVEAVATVDENTGEVTIVKPGTTTITATVTDGANNTYPVKTASYSLQVDKATANISFITPDPSVTWSETSTENVYSQTVQQKTSTDAAVVAESASPVTYSIIGNTSTCGATIDGSTVTFTKAGSVSILATVEDNDYYTYTAKTASYTLTVNPHAGKLTLSATGGTVNFGSTGTFTVTDHHAGGVISVASDDGTIATASYDDPTVTITSMGAGSTKITVTCAATDCYAEIKKEYDLVVGIVTAGVTPPTVNYLTYNGDPQPLLTAGSTEGGTLYYRYKRLLDFEYSAWSTEVPMATNADTYNVQYKVEGDANHSSLDATALNNVVIAKATPTGVWSNATASIGCGASFTRTYTITGVKGEVFTTNYSSSQEAHATVNASGVVTALAVGNTKIKAYSAATDNYNKLEAEYDLSVTIGMPDVDAPAAINLTYDGTEQALITKGSTSGGTLEYSSNNSSWSETVPKATDAGDYTVYYRVVGNANYASVPSTAVNVTISPKSVTAPTIVLAQNSYTYDGSAKTPAVSAVRDGQTTIPASEYTVSYSYNENAGNADETPTVTITDKDGGNYTVNGNQTFTINRRAGSVTLSANYGDMIINNSRAFTVSGSHGGALSVSSSDASQATASINGTTVTVTGKATNTTPTITVTCAETRNYEAATATYIAYVAPTLSQASTSHLGWCISSDGYIFASNARCQAAGQTSMAVIAYIGSAGSAESSSTTYKGLALALTDVSSSRYTWATSTPCSCVSRRGEHYDAITIKDGLKSTNTLVKCTAHTHNAAKQARNYSITRPSGTSAWFLPSIGQWNMIVKGLASKKMGTTYTTNITLGSSNNYFKSSYLNSVIEDAGGTGLIAYEYWSSTESSDEGAWPIIFQSGSIHRYSKRQYSHYVRAVFAF